MPTFLIEHMEGCTPAKPCLSCKVAQFLWKKLSPEDFNKLLELISTETSAPSGLPPYGPDNPVPLEASIDVLELRGRTRNVLHCSEIHTIGDLTRKTDTELLILPHMGRKSLKEIGAQLPAFGRKLKERM